MSILEDKLLLIYFSCLAIVFGAAMGSFLNCAAFRIARGESFVRGRSRCPSCGHVLTARELIPIISFLLQRGRCRACGAKLSARYPLTEAFFALLTLLNILVFGLSPDAVRNEIFFSCLFTLSLVDLEIYEIPDGCLLIGLAAWLLALPFTGGLEALKSGLLSALVFGGGVLLISLIMDRLLGRESLGGGDIKLIALCALYLGLIGSLFMTMLSCALGLLAAAIMKKSGKAGEKAKQNEGRIAFGPALSLAAVLMLLFGGPLIDRYIGLFS